jgi:hypothetical protein
MGKELNVSQIKEILASGNFDQFRGAIETEICECKSIPYRLDQIHQKQELSKDVSGLANAGGGVILVGLHTEAIPSRAEEEVAEIKPFAASLFDVQQHHDVLKSWLHPVVEGIEINWHPCVPNSVKGIGSILVPPQPSERRPFLITRTVDERSKTTEIVFGYAERRRTSVDPISVARLQSLLQTGLHLSSRIGNIEAMLGQFVAKSESQSTSLPPNPVSSNGLCQRIERAIEIADLAGKPSFAFGVRPVSATNVPTLFQSKNAEIVKLLEHPPQFRRSGFNLYGDAPAQIVQGMLRRVVSPGNKLLELWRDGSLIFVGQGNEWFLCWPPSTGEKPRDPLIVNSIALLESAYLFAELSTKLFSLAVPPPEEVEYICELHQLTRDQPSGLAVLHQDGLLYRVGSTAPSSGNRWVIDANLKTTQPGQIAFKIAACVFEWYGAEHDQIPFQKEQGVIDIDLLYH